MNKCFEKLYPNLYGADLIHGKINPKPSHVLKCFFIVEHVEEQDFIKKQAIQLLIAGCREFVFYGAKEPIWHLGFDETDILLYSDMEDIALTDGEHSITDFAESIDEALHVRPFVPCENYLFYDDIEKYHTVVDMIREMGENYEPYNSYDVEEMVHLVLSYFPEQVANIDEATDLEGKIMGHYFGELTIAWPMEEMYKTNRDDFIKCCHIIQLLWDNGDTYIHDVLDTSILEYLSNCDEEVWVEFGKHISDDFKYYINHELIRWNLMMGGPC